MVEKCGKDSFLSTYKYIYMFRISYVRIDVCVCVCIYIYIYAIIYVYIYMWVLPNHKITPLPKHMVAAPLLNAGARPRLRLNF